MPSLPESAPQPLPPEHDRHPWVLVALLLIAAASRCLALSQYASQLHGDPDAYREIAQSIVDGNGFGFFPGRINGSPTAYRPPVYPLLLAAITACCAGKASLIPPAIGLAQLMLGIATVAITVLLGRRLELGRLAYVAGALVSVDPLLVHGTSLVMTETTATFLVTLALWLGLGATRRTGQFAAGLAFGLSWLCRPTFAAFGALAALCWLAFRWRAMRNRCDELHGSPRSFCHALLAALGAAVAIAPWAARNAISMGQPILTTTHGGYTLLLAHNPFYTRAVVEQPWGATWAIDSDHDWFQWLETEMGRETPPVSRNATPAAEIARDRWMNRRAWSYMGNDPVVAIRSGLTLLGRFWNVAPLATPNRPVSQSLRWIIGLFYVLTFSLAILAVIRLRREEWTRWWPLVALIASFTLVHSLYWSDMRMRAPLVPAIALFAARGLFGLVGERPIKRTA